VPLPLLYVANSSTEKQIKIKEIVNKKQIHPSDVKSLLKFCFEAEAFEYVRKLAKKNENEALYDLSLLKPSTAKGILLEIIETAYACVEDLCI